MKPEQKEWLKLLAKPKAEPKPKPIPKQPVKDCKKHKSKLYGNVPCYQCLQADKKFMESGWASQMIIDLKYANIFAKHTGVWFNAMSPGVRFGIHHDWYETFDIPSGVLKKMVEKMDPSVING